MAYIAFADGKQQPVENLADISLNYAQEAVGGYVEMVCPRKSPDVVILCNEDGLAQQLPPNQHASDLYGGPVVGDVIVMTRSEARKAKWL